MVYGIGVWRRKPHTHCNPPEHESAEPASAIQRELPLGAAGKKAACTAELLVNHSPQCAASLSV
jgi:hypothetical protein